ncbi:MAG TPA: MBL fold metallo-hydrolase [Micropepsaceae bacterium]|nr:MBL fold metallo-hydrolase [Micropepsaceae bacterium]
MKARQHAISFDRNFDAPYEQLTEVAANVRHLLAHNPSPFTFKGTGVYVVGRGRVAVIDPGPDDSQHLESLRRALGQETVTHILITHTHRDHSPAAKVLKAWTGAKTYGFGPHGSGRESEGPAVEEGGDRDFVPDIAVRNGELIKGDGFGFRCIHTPGHTSNHMSYALEGEQALFTGDHVMGWSTSVVAPPDGDMAFYRASLKKLLEREDRVYWPTHGGPIREPKRYVAALIAHRDEREADILAALKDGVATIPAMVERIYVGLDTRLKGAAALSVLAHLDELIAKRLVIAEGEAKLSGRFRPF